MMHRHPQIALLALVSLWAAGVCNCFSFDSSFATRPLPASSFVRHRRPSSYSIKSLGTSIIYPQHSSAVPLTTRWHSPTEEAENAASSPASTSEMDLHPPTIQAIASALLIRAQNSPSLPLRLIDDGNMEEWEVTLAAGKIAESSAMEWAMKQGLSPAVPAHQEVMQVMAGRVVAVLTRLEELEWELLNRISTSENNPTVGFDKLGVPEEEMKAWQPSQDADSDKKQKQASSDAAAGFIDGACLFDEKLRINRSRALLAIFLEEIEGPGLRRNNVVVPCMDVDFLSEDEWGILFSSRDEVVERSSAEEKSDDEAGDNMVEEEKPARPSLHPITIDAIEEAFILRAQNSTTSPLRLVDSNMEWFEVQYSIVKYADRFLEKFTRPSSRNKEDLLRLTEEEVQAIGGRIVGVLMRLDDLEWEWNHRISTSTLAEIDSPTMIPQNEWKTTLGLHPEGVEQSCVYTVDMALTEEKEFARARAERMLALFLLNVEGPGLKASGNKVAGGSEPDFIEDGVQLELMMPRPRK